MVGMTESVLCPFSKPIIGQWCRCPHAVLAERCSGKMVCDRAADVRPRCMQLVDSFRQQSRFVLGLTRDTAPLTHTQSMKIRCGGLLGMHRLLNAPGDIPSVVQLIRLAEQEYTRLSAFPFEQLVRDISSFSHRRKLRNPSAS